MTLKAAMATIFFFCLWTATFAQDCNSIEDATARLACYDAAANPKPAKQQPSSSALTSAMLELRAKLDKTFLEAGINIEVMALSKREFPNGKLPQLVLFGYMNRASVYRIITNTDLIRQARGAGFQSLHMWGKGEGGHWIFDLSGTGSACSRDLCF